MILIRAGSLWGGAYYPFIDAQMLEESPGAVSREDLLLASLTRLLEPLETVEWVALNTSHDEEVIIIDPGPFEAGAKKDGSLELLLIQEPEEGSRDNLPIIEGPRLATALYDWSCWLSVSLALAPTGWAQEVAVQFNPGKDGLRQVFRLPEV